ncbi:MAG: type II toxin-antitoxin system RelE/ParE family toxin [Anaerolineaceae bacterium]|nr:type II toxin-antitoxin system RelE/ParE family toxin [Anaerolineaceae bacterium]
MPNNPIHIVFGQQFVKDLKHLTKKYPNIRDDVSNFINLLQSGETPGDQIRGTGYTVYKARIRNSDLTKGKSGGYRIIYFVQTPTELALITIYVKSERVDLSVARLKQMLEDYFKANS